MKLKLLFSVFGVLLLINTGFNLMIMKQNLTIFQQIVKLRETEYQKDEHDEIQAKSVRQILINTTANKYLLKSVINERDMFYLDSIFMSVDNRQ